MTNSDLLLRQVTARIAGHKLQRLLGYWVLVQTYGSHKAVRELPFMARASVERQRYDFREAFGMEPEDLVLALPKIVALGVEGEHA